MSERQGILGCLRFIAFVFLVSIVAPALALTGPAPVTALPGSGSVVDTDSGNGQAWGRVGGRTFTFTVNDLSQFSALNWGVVTGTNPSVAFDGTVDAAGETMSFKIDQSNLGGGVAVWTGTANLALLTPAGTFAIPTRFTLTLRDAGNAPIAIQVDGSGLNPSASVIGSQTFKANLLFEMFWNNQWRPVLDQYDALATVPGTLPSTNQGPVMSGVNTGFYYTGSGISLTDHDANMNAQLASIKGDTSFIRTDATQRLQQIGSALGDVGGNVSSTLSQVSHIQQGVDQLNTASSNNATHSDIQSLSQGVGQIQQSLTQLMSSGSGNAATKSDIDSLQQTFLVLWGLAPCPPEAGALCTSAKFVQSLSTQASVDVLGGKIDGVATGVSLLGGKVDGVLAGVGTLQASVNGLASQAKVDALKSSVDGLQGGISSVQTKLDALSTEVAGDVPLHISVGQISSTPKQLRWIVTVSRDGAPVAGSMESIIVVLTSLPTPLATDVLPKAHVTQLAPGLLDVTLDLVKDVTDGAAYVFHAKFTDLGVTSKASMLVVPTK